MGAARDGKGNTDQQHNRHFKKQWQRANQAGNPHRIVRAAFTECLQHPDGYLINRTGFMQDFAEHRAQCDDNGEKTEGATHAFLHGVSNFIDRHAGENSGTD